MTISQTAKARANEPAIAFEGAPSTTARILFAILVGRAVFGLSYLVGSARASPIPWYYPLERRWAFESIPTGFAMAWYGRTAVAFAVGALALFIAFWAATRAPLARSLSRPSNIVAIARAVGLMMLLDFAYFGWVLMHQTPAPLPLPPGISGF